ncbi:hypothetical protein KFK14_05180 [Sphingobium phenoxybenzoativorans]|uniref:Uncharacterized protein n=1 Tax=Sphingobium phenoxybenzoativorans TaxID=1592790 RepID=A0A975Q2M3_9SPHN|nr:hypothetical protein [Sphingobium phenoxybenzoativorans]QUT06836.1 hypothetical protein KFK14_05180 [Sphingobium phenoxybenzoativorans]
MDSKVCNWSMAGRQLFHLATDRQPLKKTGGYRPMANRNPTFRNRLELAILSLYDNQVKGTGPFRSFRDNQAFPAHPLMKRYLQQCHSSPLDPNGQLALVMVLIEGRKREPTLNQYLAMTTGCP